jgi:predicted AlkP superfamily phosphohydrolase/phosphomutase
MIAILLVAGRAEAYVGPGAGFAFITSFFFLIVTFFVALFSFLVWPVRFILARIRRRKSRTRAKAKRAVIVGLDGLDPDLAKKFMTEGKMPNFTDLAEKGSFQRLRTSCPPLSPVAWSSFMTGCKPARHNIYDFLSRDPRNYLPTLSSAHIGPAKRTLKIGKYSVPLGKPVIKLLRKSKPFWQVLGKNGIFSTVIRVPITFPPEKFNGLLLSGMCVPDLKGSQGTFSFFSSNDNTEAETTGGIRVPVEREGNIIRGHLYGPTNTISHKKEDLSIPFQITLNGDSAKVAFPDQSFELRKGEYSPWIRLSFKAGLRINVQGIARFMITETEPEFKMYVSPINIDPEKPPFDISYPRTYGLYLSKLLGPYATLGLAEDTWALNEEVIDDQAFLDQAYLNHAEREEMLFDALEKNREGLVVCVFDTTDRIQHMFFRYLNPNHPALRNKDQTKHETAIEDLYRRMDDLLGRISEELSDGDELIVMSDHGFKDFSRGVNINSWFCLNGYMSLKDNGAGMWLSNVDWAKTRAYAIGLGGIYLNLQGREAFGIVEPGHEEEALKKEIIAKLSGLRDRGKGSKVAVTRVLDRGDAYRDGPYVKNAPDLIVCYNKGYRASWDCAQGKVTDDVFEDNIRAWSGDHCIDPAMVPGVLFTSFKTDTKNPSIIDIAPTALSLLGVEIPGYMEGKSLVSEQPPRNQNG